MDIHSPCCSRQLASAIISSGLQAVGLYHLPMAASSARSADGGHSRSAPLSFSLVPFSSMISLATLLQIVHFCCENCANRSILIVGILSRCQHFHQGFHPSF